jgi:ADP-ribose pyrophosphatase YjhB (NUDIX family)
MISASNPSVGKFEETHPPLATVGALIFNGASEVLMIRTNKWSNLWGIPGGKIKWGEPSEAALRREIKEETGLRVTDIQFVLVQDCIHSREFYRDAHFVLLNYTCRCAGKQPRVKLNHEARASRWVAPAVAAQMPLNTPTRILLEAVLKKRKRGAQRLTPRQPQRKPTTTGRHRQRARTRGLPKSKIANQKS